MAFKTATNTSWVRSSAASRSRVRATETRKTRLRNKLTNSSSAGPSPARILSTSASASSLDGLPSINFTHSLGAVAPWTWPANSGDFQESIAKDLYFQYIWTLEASRSNKPAGSDHGGSLD